MAEYTPISDTSTALREALVELDILRKRISEVQAESGRVEELRRGLTRELAVARSTIDALQESLYTRSQQISYLLTLKNRSGQCSEFLDNLSLIEHSIRATQTQKEGPLEPHR